MRESRAGGHYYGSYLDCPRKWYLKYYCEIAPRYISRHLIFGGVIHQAFEAYWRAGRDMTKGIEVFLSSLEERRLEYEKVTDFDEDRNRGPMMLAVWEQTWGDYDRENYEFVEAEQQYVMHVGPEGEFEFTIRPDLVKRDKRNNAYIIVDYKTTGYSVSKAFQAAEMNDQVTSYVWAVRTNHPEWEVPHAEIDVLYNRGQKIEAERPGAIYRTEEHLRQFEVGLVGTITEVTQKVKALDDGYPEGLLFPRNGRMCGLFGCEYEKICRTKVERGVVPPGFVHDVWDNEEKA